MHMRYLVLVLVVIVTACGVNGQKKDAKAQPVASATPALKVSDTVRTISRTDEEWKKVLSTEQFHVLRDKGTDAPLFTSDMKFDSHCGWPSFDREVEGGKVKTQVDNSLGMQRIEIMCGRCGSHLGHLFDDGPTLTGKRYCVNSTSIEFTPAPGKKKN